MTMTIENNKCLNCKNWGFNCGKVQTSTGDSYCKKLKRNSFALQICKNFERKLDK